MKILILICTIIALSYSTEFDPNEILGVWRPLLTDQTENGSYPGPIEFKFVDLGGKNVEITEPKNENFKKKLSLNHELWIKYQIADKDYQKIKLNYIGQTVHDVSITKAFAIINIGFKNMVFLFDLRSEWSGGKTIYLTQYTIFTDNSERSNFESILVLKKDVISKRSNNFPKSDAPEAATNAEF